MATIALSVAGQFAGGLVGGPIGATVGRALGALAGSALDQHLFGPSASPRAARGRLNDLSIQSSREGEPIPRIYGWNRISGELIWATQLVEHLEQAEQQGGKGASEPAPSTNPDPHYSYSANFAVGLCEGEITHFGRIWADGKLIDKTRVTLRYYKGTQDQQPDSLIEAKEGAGNVPAYRGLAYVVFDNLPLADYGNRIPQLSFEICRTVGDLEDEVTAVTLIPGATEYGYDPRPLSDLARPGVARIENAHQSGKVSDWELSLDQLVELFPNIDSVALVVTWFGTDLRVNNCQILPGIENRQKNVAAAPWKVSNATRADAHLISSWQGGPAFGGTPNDASVIRAITDLKARGIKVTFYPFLLMDIPPDNGLADPYGGAEQANFPWRGRITCHPAIGEDGSPDKSAAATTQISGFLGNASAGDFSASGETVTYAGPSEWSYRRMILHYAHLCELAGGVDAFLIGSELRGLTQVRSATQTFPFVAALETLAQDVRTILSPSSLISYGADWSEYFGYQPGDGSGDVLFHLDDLWASSAIDAIGIDNYMPLADWRDGVAHLDASAAASIYQRDYLQGNIAGGEGYDWYYASTADRQTQTQTRTEISDGAYGEPWIYRYKDLKSWWQNAHHNRPGGVRNVTATAFVPESKPIWFTEVGCGAVEKGANQPNLFSDPKSVENGVPYFSNGAKDALMQRQFLRAHLNYWRTGGKGYSLANNPVSSVYGQPMVAPDRLYVWTWDARPFPAFPTRTDIWSDGDNWQTGHWLNGRAGTMSMEELLTAILADYDIENVTINAETLLLDGYRIADVTTPRQALEPLLHAANLQLFSQTDTIHISRAQPRAATQFERAELAANNAGPIVEKSRADRGDLAGQLVLNFIDRARDYRSTSVTVRSLARPGTNSDAVGLPIALGFDGAELLAKNLLQNIWAGQEALKIALPPSQIALGVGDTITLAGAQEKDYVVTALTDTDLREVEARSVEANDIIAAENFQPSFQADQPLGFSDPLIKIFQLPGEDAARDQINLHAAVFADPWPGSYSLLHSYAGAENLLATLRSSATIGTLLQDFNTGPGTLWDEINMIEVELGGGHLSSMESDAVLAGANRLAIEKDDGSWEIIGFAQAELVAERTYQLTRLLRDQRGSNSGSIASAGKAVVLLSDAVVTTQLGIEALEQQFDLSLVAAGTGYDAGFAQTITARVNPLHPLAPVHLSAARAQGQVDIAIDWIRQSRLGGHSWAASEIPLDSVPENYQLQIYNGATLVREIEIATPTYLYTEADQIADFGSAATTIGLAVAQLSAVIGPGTSTTGEFDV